MQGAKPGRRFLGGGGAVLLLLGSLVTFSGTPALARPGSDLTRYVNPFIGTDEWSDTTHYGFGFDSGDVFPGAAYPQGMLYWSPDTDDAQHRNQAGGYWYPQTYVKGFSLTHFSGRGCNVYQDLPIMPINGGWTLTQPPNRKLYEFRSSFSHGNETASPGYYRVALDSGISVELTVTPRSGLGSFSFPGQDLSTLVLGAGGSVNTTHAAGTGIAIDPGSRLVTGSAQADVGCPAAGTPPYTVYFAVQFDQPFAAYGTWDPAQVRPGDTSASGANSGAWLSFDTAAARVGGGPPGVATVHVRPAISYVSVANAVENLQAEQEASWDFDRVAAAADRAWNAKLSRIRVAGGSDAELTDFYTALYHCFFHPNAFNDVNGQYLGMDGQVHTVPAGHTQYQMIPGWDHWRSAIRLLAMIAPAEASDVVQSLVNWAEQGGGGMPRWQQANRNSNGMVGDSPAAYVASAYALGARDFDTTAAFHALDLAGSIPGTLSDGHPVRDGLTQWNQRGYLANRPSESYEYANDDFSLAMFADALGNTARRDFYLQRAFNWKNTFNTAHGYVQSRNADGSWKEPFDPNLNRDGMVEGNAAQYTWMLPFDHRGMFDKIRESGQDPLARLNEFFTQLNAGPNNGHMWIGNEPSLNSPWEYDFIGAPARAQDAAWRIEHEAFTPTPRGLPGNDDGGATSSWFVLAALGIFPEIGGSDVVVFGSPLFASATLDIGGGRSLTINGIRATPDARYVQSLRLNGTAYGNDWMRWSKLATGSVRLDFVLVAQPSDWGSDLQNAPPSWDGEPPGPPTYDSLAQAFDNKGVSDDGSTAAANYDGSGYSYSLQALAASGLTPGATVSFAGVDFTWPAGGSGEPNNATCAGQVIRLGAVGNRLAFLGSATTGPSTGTLNVRYTDGSSQDFTLGFSDWTLNGGGGQLLDSNQIVATMPYRNHSTMGQQARVNYVFYTAVDLDPTKTVDTVRLPPSLDRGNLHVFALGIA